MDVNMNRVHQPSPVRYTDWRACTGRLQHHNYQFVRTVQEMDALDQQNKATLERLHHELGQWQARHQASIREQEILRKELLKEKSRRLDDLVIFQQEIKRHREEERTRGLAQPSSDETGDSMESDDLSLQTPFSTPVSSQRWTVEWESQ